MGGLLDTALSKAKQGNRNETGLWLACQLRDSGYTEAETKNVMLDYASQVHGDGADPYTRAEAMATLKSAFSKPARAKGIGGDSNVGKPCQPVNGTAKQIRNRVDTPEPNSVNSDRSSSTEEGQNTLENAILALAGRCDGAIKKDHQGFSKFDVDFFAPFVASAEAGRAIAGPLRDRVTKRLGKYISQLTEMGVNFNELLLSEAHGSADYASDGLTLAALAEAKRLPVDFLKSLGASDFQYCGQSSVKVPYYGEDGTEGAVRFRLALTASGGVARFRWRTGDHALPYGLNRLQEVRKAGWVLVVEGESDCWTCWYHDIPALVW